MAHNEKACHNDGERRQNYLNQIRCLLDQMDDTPCVKDTGGTVGQESFEKPLLEFPGYINRLNPKFSKPFYQPLSLNLVAERTMYCDEDQVPINAKAQLPKICKHVLTQSEMEKGPISDFVPKHATRSKPAEIKMGLLIEGCDCRKRNGLQDKCPRSECGGKPTCLTTPEPTCGPASNYLPPPHQKSREEMVAEAFATWDRPKLEYCCCTPDCGGGIQTYGNTENVPTKFPACYPCSQ